MRADQTNDTVIASIGDPEKAFRAGGPHRVRDIFRCPYQAHAPFGPNCALADVGPDGALVMSSTQDIYNSRDHAGDGARHAGRARSASSTTRVPARSATAATRMPPRPPRSCRRRLAARCACNSCAGTNTAGTITARPNLPTCVPAIDANGKIVAYEYHGWQHGWNVTENVARTCAADGAGRGRTGGPFRSRSIA